MRPILPVALLIALPAAAACPPLPGPLDPDRGWAMDVLDAPCDDTILGAAAGALSPSKPLAGDLDADGIPDLVFASREVDPLSGVTTVADAFVFFGPRSAPSFQDLATDAPSLAIRGESGRWAVPTAIGDLTGDGIDDLVLLEEALVACNHGGVVVLAGPLSPGEIRLVATSPWARLRPSFPCDINGEGSLGQSMAVGDVTGDGQPDLVLTSYKFMGPRVGWNPAELRIVPGPLAAGATIDIDADPAVTRVIQPAATDGFGGLGQGMAIADLSGDGVGDLVVSDPAQRDPSGLRIQAGRVHVLFGPIAPGLRDLAVAPAEAQAVGPDAYGVLGVAIATGDLTGDGRPDIVAGSPYVPSTLGAQGAGAAYVIEGPLAPGVLDLATSPAHAIVLGAFGDDAALVGDELGWNLDVGDVDGDGRPDLLAGAPDAHQPDGSRDESGHAVVVRGPLAGGRLVDLACERPDIDVRGARERDFLGNEVLLADLDGNGAEDIVVSAPLGAGPGALRPMAGEVHVVDGTNLGPDAAHGGPYGAECDAAGITVALDARASADPEGQPLRFAWATDCPNAAFDDASSVTPLMTVRLDQPACERTCRVAVTATDCLGAFHRVVTALTVRDTSPPVITVSSDTIALAAWPPSHRAWRVGRDAFRPDVRDACGNPVTWRFAGCVSDEPDDSRGDGATSGDCVVVDDGAALMVRAERQGMRRGRSYAVSVVASDACGNETAPVTAGHVVVPHDQRTRGRRPSR